MELYFSKNLKSLRNYHKIRQFDFDEMLGLGKGNVSNYEGGKNNPTFETLVKMAALLGVSVDDLLTADMSGNIDKYLQRNITKHNIQQTNNGHLNTNTISVGGAYNIADILADNKILANKVEMLETALKDKEEIITLLKQTKQ